MDFDILSFQFKVEVKREFRNISKHKRVMMPLVYSDFKLYINNLLLDEEEVFVEDIFFETLINQGKFPLFTCTCGIFGCGGYYVDVIYNQDGVIWLTEQSPFNDKTLSHRNEFRFSWENIINFSKGLVQRFEEVNGKLLENGQEIRFPTKKYREIIENRLAKLNKYMD
jgi:hypothetical protein